MLTDFRNGGALTTRFYNRFAHRTASVDLLGSLVDVHVPGLTADESFVRFDSARHLVDRSSVHRVTDTLKHEPRRSLRDLEIPRDFVAAHAVLTVRKKPHRAKPFIQPDGTVLEDRTDLNGELLLAVQALPHQSCFEERMPLGFTAGADRPPCAPLGTGYNIQADFWVREYPDRLNQATGILEVSRFHELIISGEPR